MRSEQLSIYTTDQVGSKWYISDAENIVIRNTENGFSNATWDLKRNFSSVYDDLGLNFPVLISNGRDDVAWQGLLEGYEPRKSQNNGTVSCSAVGYWATLYWLPFNGIIAAAAPETQIAGLVSGGYATQLSSTTSLVATGVVANPYQTGNGGTDDVRPGDIIFDLCKAGTSTQQRVVPAVWENRILTTTALALTPSARYRVSSQLVDGIALRRNLSTIGTRVLVRYVDSTTHALARIVVNDATTQANLAAYLGGAVSYIKTEILDISGLNEISAAVATATANTRLNNAKKVKSDSPITISTEYSIFDLSAGQEIPLWAVRAGYWLQIPDLVPRTNEIGGGTAGGDVAVTSLFYISQCEYQAESNTLTITPENPSSFTDIVS